MIGISIANSLGLNKLSGINPDAQAFITATGITGTTEVNAINNLVTGLKADGLWSKMKAVYPFVTDNRNLLSYTDTFSNSYWTKDGVTITSGQTDPTGGSNATRVVGTTPSRSLYGLITLTTGATYTLSCYVKSTGGSNQTFRIYANGGSPFSSNLTATSTWQQVTLTFTAIAGTNSFGITRDTSSNNYDILVYGIQLELGSTATTYQPIATTQQAYIAAQFKYNLVNPVDLDAAFRLVFNGGWTHSSTGATPNGTNAWADTKLNVNNILDSTNSHLSYYSRTIATAGAGLDYYMMGAYNAPTDAYYSIDMNGTTPNIYAALGSVANVTNINCTNSRGYFVIKKETNNNQKAIKNNSILDTKVQISANKPSFNVGLSALNFNAGLYGYSPFQCALATIGNGLTDTEASNLYSRVQTYQNSLNRAI